MTAPTSLAPRKRPTPLRRLGWLLPLAAALTACTTLRPPAQVTPATPTSWQAPLPHEGQLQQLFLQADPELRKRFIGWAVPRL